MDQSLALDPTTTDTKTVQNVGTAKISGKRKRELSPLNQRRLANFIANRRGLLFVVDISSIVFCNTFFRVYCK